jgi:hypothetical protein
MNEWGFGMKDNAAVVVLSLLMVFFLASFPSPRASGSCAQCWVPTSSPIYVKLGAYSSFQIGYFSVMNSDVTGLVFAVVHNYLNQTVEISTATLQLAQGAHGTTNPVIFGLASGTYSATFFATQAGRVAISPTTTQTFTI